MWNRNGGWWMGTETIQVEAEFWAHLKFFLKLKRILGRWWWQMTVCFFTSSWIPTLTRQDNWRAKSATHGQHWQQNEVKKYLQEPQDSGGWGQTTSASKACIVSVLVREETDRNKGASRGPKNKFKMVNVHSPKSRKCQFEVNSWVGFGQSDGGVVKSIHYEPLKLMSHGSLLGQDPNLRSSFRIQQYRDYRNEGKRRSR